ncbi:hypothetical protein CSHISOI_07856 [Colletotrichum shisoi]|uniref:Uncharacterized protein n=1 Tax=Colletotrichum shisoi TaxID=2078593 RepID=A0A5Q4BM31_9PEZI|nr:hypothetical protein CSHISOI_07856 [Colletotrichum shisoi]
MWSSPGRPRLWSGSRRQGSMCLSRWDRMPLLTSHAGLPFSAANHPGLLYLCFDGIVGPQGGRKSTSAPSAALRSPEVPETGPGYYLVSHPISRATFIPRSASK